MSTGVHCEEGLVMNTLVDSVHRKFRGVFPYKMLCCLSFANSCLLKSIQSETATDLSISAAEAHSEVASSLKLIIS